MSIVFDLILIIVAGVIIISGFKKGLVKSVFGLAVNVVALIVSNAFSPYLSEYLYNNIFLQKIASGIEGTVASVARTGNGYDFVKMINEMPEILSQMLEKYNVSESAFSEFVPTVASTGEEGVRTVAEYIATPVATVISNVLAFIAVFVAALIVLKIVAALIAFIFKAPVLKTVDKTAGLVLGIINALIVVWVLSAVFAFGIEAAGSVAPDWFGENVVENSIILKLFNEFNPISFVSSIVEFEM